MKEKKDDGVGMVSLIMIRCTSCGDKIVLMKDMKIPISCFKCKNLSWEYCGKLIKRDCKDCGNRGYMTGYDPQTNDSWRKMCKCLKSELISNSTIRCVMNPQTFEEQEWEKKRDGKIK